MKPMNKLMCMIAVGTALTTAWADDSQPEKLVFEWTNTEQLNEMTDAQTYSAHVESENEFTREYFFYSCLKDSPRYPEQSAHFAFEGNQIVGVIPIPLRRSKMNEGPYTVQYRFGKNDAMKSQWEFNGALVTVPNDEFEQFIAKLRTEKVVRVKIADFPILKFSLSNAVKALDHSISGCFGDGAKQEGALPPS